MSDLHRHGMTPAALCALVCLCLAAPAAGQDKQPYKMDPNAPLDYTADAGGGYDPVTCSIRLQGRAEITQDKTRIRSQLLTAFSAKERSGCGSVERWEAKGDVFYITPDQHVRSDSAIYDVPKKMVTFRGNVIAVQGENVSTSEVLVVNTDTNAVQMDGRIRGVIYPEQPSGSAKR